MSTDSLSELRDEIKTARRHLRNGADWRILDICDKLLDEIAKLGSPIETAQQGVGHVSGRYIPGVDGTF